MPFGVTQWGYSPDPRQVDYALLGFNFGQLPPWRWSMKTTDALPPYEILNDGLIWQRVAHSNDDAAFAPIVATPGITGASLSLRGTEFPSGGVTMEWYCGFFMTGDPFQTEGFINELYPVALTTRAFTMLNGGPPPVLIPNPLVITPHKWNED